MFVVMVFALALASNFAESVVHEAQAVIRPLLRFQTAENAACCVSQIAKAKPRPPSLMPPHGLCMDKPPNLTVPTSRPLRTNEESPTALARPLAN